LALPWLITSVHWSVSHRVETAPAFFPGQATNVRAGIRIRWIDYEDDDDGEDEGTLSLLPFKTSLPPVQLFRTS